MRALLVFLGTFLMSTQVFGLGYPIPQEKPCKTYWDGGYWRNLVAKDPEIIAYFASQHEVLARHKSGTDIQITHDAKGCLLVRQLPVGSLNGLLQRQKDA